MDFELNVYDLAGNVCKLTVDHSCTVGMVKAALQKAWEIPQRQQKLLLGANVLFDDTELLSAQNATKLTLVIQITEQDILERLGPVPPERELDGLKGCFIPRYSTYLGRELWDEAGNPKPYVELNKKLVLNEIKRVGFASDFHVHANQIKELAGTNILLIYDPDKVYGEIAILCTTDHAYEREMARIEGLRQRATEAAVANSMRRSCDAVTKAHVEVEQKSGNEQVKADCQTDLDELSFVLNALKEAVAALSFLSQGDLKELKAMKTPPTGVLLVAEALCIMFNVKPAQSYDKFMKPDYWQASKKMLFGDPLLMMRLMKYDKDNIPPEVMQKVSPFEHHADFQPDDLKKVSGAAWAICKWVHAMILYDRATKNCEQEQKNAMAKSEKVLAAGDVLEVSPLMPAATPWCFCGVR
eukprot:gnl/MRDRNA2_/MRDRNA2_63217_c0_seq1.p1 gnl/MRDRNA2_/MRDRNA2_63217_c0~~gnl/MRDRNA2_/MRDRNA2_63217_c0_seq1.p1  ORF type:complete len:413 (+),score=91.48 gnl/MRDRNA2_/MRDRNA2_63217_c0_seq1:78-1316(+)